jgi:hypothetical protein
MFLLLRVDGVATFGFEGLTCSLSEDLCMVFSVGSVIAFRKVVPAIL